MKLAFAGFRHGHVMSLWNIAGQHPTVKVVAACEEDEATRRQLADGGKVAVTHTDYARMLREVDCDAVAVGDYFAKRGEMILAALDAGKHVIADKPICTRLSELDRIEALAKEKGRVVGCLLDLRDNGVYRAMRRIVREGTIGEVHTVTVLAQHPLLWGTRPGWYFEGGKHGGTINDIGVHAIDLIPWLTGRALAEVVAARGWNANVKQVPSFQDAGQFMLRLDNGGGALGDVSYLTPDGIAYSANQYWRVTVHGSEGMIEGRYGGKTVELATRADKEPRQIPADPERTGGVLDDFIAEVGGATRDGNLTMREVFDASRKTLQIQQAADQAQCRVSF